jgi:hypothetical protein
MRGCKFLRLMSNKVTLRSFSYLLHFLHLILGKNDFSNYVQNCLGLCKNHKEFIGVKWIASTGPNSVARLKQVTFYYSTSQYTEVSLAHIFM